MVSFAKTALFPEVFKEPAWEITADVPALRGGRMVREVCATVRAHTAMEAIHMARAASLIPINATDARAERADIDEGYTHDQAARLRAEIRGAD